MDAIVCRKACGFMWGRLWRELNLFFQAERRKEEEADRIMRLRTAGIAAQEPLHGFAVTRKSQGRFIDALTDNKPLQARLRRLIDSDDNSQG